MTQHCATNDLAKRYQPRRLAEKFGGLDVLVNRFLARSIAQQTMPRLIAFTGPPGCGKGTTARIVARRHSCEHKEGHPYDPCLSCKACRSVDREAGSSQNTDYGYTELDSTRLSGEDIAKIIERESKYLSIEGGNRQLFIVDEVMRNRTALQERLLRLCENTRSYIILCTIDPHGLKPELLDRFIHLRLKVPTQKQVEHGLARIALAEGFKLDPDAAAYIAAQEQDNPRRSIKLLETAMTTSNENTIDADAVSAALELRGIAADEFSFLSPEPDHA